MSADMPQLPLFDEEPRVPSVQVVCDDVLAWAEKTPPIGAHAMLCDPPYELNFMGRNWDRSGIAFKADTWKALAQHLLPGAFGMCFASSRGWHRLACAIEDAGLIIHPSIFGWGFGSGFPKASRVDAVLEKQRHDDIRPVCRFLRAAMERHYMTSGTIAEQFGFHSRMVDHWAARDTDSQPSVPTWEQWQQLKVVLSLSDEMDAEVWRLNGRKGQPDETWYEREVIGKAPWTNSAHHFQLGANHTERVHLDLTAPATPLAQAWAGHRYGLQALKPALEPIIVWQKPYQGKPVQSITQTGAGALWIEGSRIDGKRWAPNFALCHTDQCIRVGEQQVKVAWSQPIRGTDDGSQIYPLNRADTGQAVGFADATGHETVAAWDCAPGCPVAALDAQAGERQSAYPGNPEAASRYTGHDIPDNGVCYGRGLAGASRSYSDTGSASRFFFTDDWSLDIAERLAQADPVHYSAKASRRERDAGLEHLPLAYHDTAVSRAAQVQGLENTNGRGSHSGPGRNPHPTIKPLKLCQWLATLLLPPAAYAPRRILVPFCGTGSEAIGAMLSGWDEIVMIEQDQSYVEIAKARMAYWQQDGLKRGS